MKLNITQKDLPTHPSIQTRAIFLLVTTIILLGAGYMVTGAIFPQEVHLANIFQGGLLLVIFGSFLLEDKFVKPADAFVNGVAATISLIPVFESWKNLIWVAVFIYCLLVAATGFVSLLIGKQDGTKPLLHSVSKVSYQLSTTFGKSHVIFSIVFLHAIYSFYRTDSIEAVALIGLWGIYVVLWPLKIPHILEAIFSPREPTTHIGTIIRVENPNLIRVELKRDRIWLTNDVLVACLGDGRQRSIIPLFEEVHDETVIGTGILADGSVSMISNPVRGSTYTVTNIIDENRKQIIGLVKESSRIAELRFETWCPDLLEQGVLVYCQIGKEQIYYQIEDAATSEEPLERHRHGFQTVVAAQIGTIDEKVGFKKYNWLPEMNSPVYLAEELATEPELDSSHFVLGTAPGSEVQIVCDLEKLISHHTAILGVTGAGKTELAFQIIRQAIENQVKVLCVDITGDYLDSLSSAEGLNPVQLSISDELATDLGEKLFDVETGTFGAPKEKKVLKEFADGLRQEISETVTNFLDGDELLGIFTIPTISNTRATVFATEMYLTSIFEYARNPDNEQQILVVLEEAHTVVPEASTMGLGDFDSKAMVAKIAQIALQGRKYKVGLLVIAQRTATVSKTVLTQCNTIIAFASFDQTGIQYLSHFFGEYANKLPNLTFLQALAFGKGVKAERPIVVEMPYNEELAPKT